MALTLIPSFFSAVSYDIMGMGGMGGSKNTESQEAQNIIAAQFPSSASSGESNIILVIQTPGSGAYSDAMKNGVFELNRTVGSDSNEVNFTGMSSVYSVEGDVLNSTLPSFVSGVAVLASNVTTINQALYSLEENLTALNSNIFQLQSGINQTAQLVYGLPAAYVGIWSGVLSSVGNNASLANQQANDTIYLQTNDFGGDPLSTSYYTSFFSNWNESFQSFPTLDPVARETASVNSTVAQFLSNPSLDNSTAALMMTVAYGLNVTDWNLNDAIGNLTLSTISSQIPSSLVSTLGVTSNDLTLDLYNLGPAPSAEELSNLTLSLIKNSFSGVSSSFPSAGFSFNDLISDSFALGSSPNSSAIWDLVTSISLTSLQIHFRRLRFSPWIRIHFTTCSRFLTPILRTAR